MCAARCAIARSGGAAAALLLAASLLQAASAAPRDATYGSVYGRVACAADALVTPKSTQQLADAVQAHAAAAAAAGMQLKVRATHAVFHSSASFPCVPASADAAALSRRAGRKQQLPHPAKGAKQQLGRAKGVLAGSPQQQQQQHQAPAGVHSVVVLTDKLNSVVKADPRARTLRAQAGMTVGQLMAEAKARGWSPPIGAGTTYGGLTLGGVLATNAHDSAFNGSSTLAHITREVTWVDASGAVRVSNRTSPEARALFGGLGLVGIISEVLVQFGPALSVRAQNRVERDDSGLLEDVLATLKASPNLAVTWHPDMGLYAMHTRDPTDAPSSGAKLSVLPTVRPIEAPILAAALDTWTQDTNNALEPLLGAGACLTTYLDSPAAHYSSLLLGPAHLGLSLPLADGVGSANDLMACDCGGFPCAWDPNGPVTVEPREFVIELEQLGGWISDVKRIFAEDLFLGGGALPNRCLIGFIWLQFGSGTSDYMATTSGMQQPVHAITMLTTSRSLAGSTHSKFGFVHDLMEQLSLCKYNGRPHPGKGSERTFTHPNCTIAGRYPLLPKLLEAQAALDPSLVFEPPLFAAVKARQGYSLTPQCDLKKTCFCESDAHCGAGFSCVPSRAFPQFKACKPPAFA